MSNNLIPNSQNNLPQNFDFNGHQVRIIIINNEPWWVASDVCKVLTLEQVSNALSCLSNEEDRRLFKITHPQSINKEINVNIVNESGLYDLIFSSKKTEAKAFKRWVTHEVLPQIRKTGSYSITQDSYVIEDPIKRAKRWIQEEEVRQQLLLENKEKSKTIEKQEEEIDFLEKEVEEKTEKAECAERFLDFEIIAFDMNEAAQTLNLELGGRNKLMEKLREDKILMKETKEVHYENGRKIIHVKNTPYSHFVQAGYFVTKTSREERENVVNIYTKTRVTTKGLDFLRRKYN